MASTSELAILQPRATRGARVEDADGLFVFVFDATTQEGHSFPADVTDHPVPDGLPVTDNIQLKPIRVTLGGVVTNTPIDPQSLVEQRNGLAPRNRIASVLDALIELRDSKQRITVVTSLRRYPNMVLANINIQRGRPVQDMRPTLEFKQIRVASTVLVPVPARILARRRKASGKSKTNNAQQSKKKANAQETLRWESKKTPFRNLTDNLARLSVRTSS